VVICGDLINTPGSEKEIREFKSIRAGFEMDCWLVPGNHDLGNRPKPDSLKQYRDVLGRDYFFKEMPRCVLIGLNTQLLKLPVEGDSDRQMLWFEESLAKVSASGKPIIVFGHQPLFLADHQEKEEYFNLPVDTRLRLLALLTRHHVAAYLAGHAHRNVATRYEGIPLVTSATTSRNFDGAPMGFRLWVVPSAGALRHEYIAVEGARPPADKSDAGAKTRRAG
jgi:3',5'-cyclic AMP phosphodiesterase CpdA